MLKPTERKICRCCKERLDLDRFPVLEIIPDGHMHVCETCNTSPTFTPDRRSYVVDVDIDDINKKLLNVLRVESNTFLGKQKNGGGLDPKDAVTLIGYLKLLKDLRIIEKKDSGKLTDEELEALAGAEPPPPDPDEDPEVTASKKRAAAANAKSLAEVRAKRGGYHRSVDVNPETDPMKTHAGFGERNNAD